MYSPHSDLYKMFHTPNFIVFRVDIGGKEYWGRPNTIRVEHPFKPGLNQQGTFDVYSNVQSFLQGAISDQIPVTSVTIKGIEAIDTVNCEPLDNILSTCFEISNIPSKADVGIIRRNIPDMLVRLELALEEFEGIHNFVKYKLAHECIEELISECKSCPHDLSENGRINLVRDLKEKVSVSVANLIELSTRQTTEVFV